MSVLLGVAASILPLAVPFFSFLWFPGQVLGFIVFGERRMLFTSANPIRAVGSALAFPAILYFGAALWDWGDAHPIHKTPMAGKYVLAIWCALLIPWLLFAPLSGMAFDAGYTAEAYAFFWSVWTYPLTVGVAAVARRWVPWIVLLPVLNFAGCGASELLHK